MFILPELPHSSIFIQFHSIHFPYRIKVGNEDIHLLNAYRPPDVYISQRDWENILSELSNYSNVIICGDLNCHHTSWGSNIPTNDNNNLFNAISDSEFKTLNNGNSTRLTSESRQNIAPDLTIASEDIHLRSFWETGTDSMGSDHLPVITTIGNLTLVFNKTFPRYRLNKVKWSAWSAEVAEKIEKLAEYSRTVEDNCLYHYERAVTIMKDALMNSSAVPPESPRTFGSPPPCP